MQTKTVSGNQSGSHYKETLSHDAGFINDFVNLRDA